MMPRRTWNGHRRAVNAPPWSGPGVSVIEWPQAGGQLGQQATWIDTYLAQRREAEKRYGKVIIFDGAAHTVFPTIPQKQALNLLQWWANRMVAVPILSVHLAQDVENYANEWEALKSAPTWDKAEVKRTWSTTHTAAQFLHASAVVDAAARENTWLRAFSEAAGDVIGPGNGPDPLGIRKLFSGIRSILVVGAVVIGGLVILNATRR